jgi:general secretion pathway protein A
MYASYYGLLSLPFAVVPDPRFIYWAEPHSMAFSMLQYGIANHAGFTVITGEIGAGKTTLIRQLLTDLPGDMNIALLNNTQGGRGELLQWVLMAFGQ